MTAAARLTAVRQAGLAVRLDAGAIKVEGPTAALARWVPELREVKGDLVSLLSVSSEPTQTDAPTLPRSTACCACFNYLPDPSGDGGLGVCRVAAPASLRPGSLWPGSTPNCQLWECTP